MPLYKVNYYSGTVTDDRNVFISSPPGYEEDSQYIDRLLKPHAVSRPGVAYDDERFSGKRRQQNRGV